MQFRFVRKLSFLLTVESKCFLKIINIESCTFLKIFAKYYFQFGANSKTRTCAWAPGYYILLRHQRFGGLIRVLKWLLHCYHLCWHRDITAVDSNMNYYKYNYCCRFHEIWFIIYGLVSLIQDIVIQYWHI